MKTKYSNLVEVTPEPMSCGIGLCPAIYKGLIEVTPEPMKCLIGSCPAIYEGLIEVTPKPMMCVVGACPSTYEATREGKEVYLIVGKTIAPEDVGLEFKVGEGESLIEVPRGLIDMGDKIKC